MNNKKLCSNCGINKAKHNHMTGYFNCPWCHKGPLCVTCSGNLNCCTPREKGRVRWIKISD